MSSAKCRPFCFDLSALTAGLLYRAILAISMNIVCIMIQPHSMESLSNYARCIFVYPCIISHDNVIKWNHFPRYWLFARGIHRSPVNSPRKGQWRGAFIFLWSAPWINGWVNNRNAGDLRRRCTHYDVTVMQRCTISAVLHGEHMLST